MNKDLLFSITKNIKEIYIKMSLDDINDQHNSNNINKLKELLLIEKNFYDNLSYDDTLTMFLELKKVSNENTDIIGRILNKLNDLLDDKYFNESLNEVTSDEILLYGDIYNYLIDSKCLKKIVNCKKYVLRDIRLLSLYYIKQMEKDGYISNEYHVGTEFCEIYRKSQTNIYSFFYPDLEDELLKTNLKLNDFNLVSNLSYQIQCLPYHLFLTAKEQAIDELLKIVIDDYNEITNKDLTSGKKLDNILYVISISKALVTVDENVKNILTNCLKYNNDNYVIHKIIMDNINNVKNDKKNIKYLSLIKNDRY